jgi:integrase
MRGYMRKRGTRRIRGTDTWTACWELFVDLGRRADGVRERRTKTVYGTEREAAKELRALLRELDAGVRRDPSKCTVAQLLRDWLKHKADVEASTREKYHEVIEQQLIPAFGRLKLDRLDRTAIRAQYARWLREGRVRGEGGFSPATIRKFHTVLREALQMAVDDGLVARNMAAGVELPKGERRERRALSSEEYARLVHAAQGSSMYAPIVTALATGMRRGELLALRWEDVDLDGAHLAIRRSLERTKSGLRLKAPKSGRSRVVGLPAIAVEILRSHRVDQNKERLSCGEAWANNDLVFSTLAGAPWDPTTFSRAFRRLGSRAGLGSMGPHTLRHTAATEMLRQGLHPKVVADRLGHSSTRMTLDVYSHVTPALESDAAARVDFALREAFGQQSGQQNHLLALPKKADDAAIPCDVNVSDGGRERSRTSGLYSVNVALYP